MEGLLVHQLGFHLCPDTPNQVLFSVMQDWIEFSSDQAQMTFILPNQRELTENLTEREAKLALQNCQKATQVLDIITLDVYSLCWSSKLLAQAIIYCLLQRYVPVAIIKPLFKSFAITSQTNLV
jgi:hypothetical protein